MRVGRVALLPFDILTGRDMADVLAPQPVEDRAVLGCEPDVPLHLPHERVLHVPLRSDHRDTGVSATLGRETGPTGDSAASRPSARDRGTSRASEASRTTVPPGVSVK